MPYRRTKTAEAEREAEDAIEAAIHASQLEAARRAQQVRRVKRIRGVGWVVALVVVFGLLGLLIDDLATRLNEPHTLCHENASGVMECVDVRPD